jgi:CRISPR-associated protein Cas2
MREVAMKMKYVLTYDIPEDPIRNRVADVLEGRGVRVQYSVFECILDPADLDNLIARLQHELRTTDGGNLRIYRLCGHCESASLGLGEVKETDQDGSALIL